MIGMFAKRNPKPSRAQVEAVGKLVAEFGATAAKLSPAARQRLVARKAELSKLIAEISAEPDMAPNTLSLPLNAKPEISQGEGQGAVVSTAEGRERLTAYATSLKIQEWAGRLAGPTELERDHGVARSTLHAWQKQGAVVGLRVGVRKHAFPVEQFIDGRPITGLAPVLDAIGDPRIAWLWLREPNPGLAGASPLAILKSGMVDSVIEVARSNFA
jgi:hypothetical protein